MSKAAQPSRCVIAVPLQLAHCAKCCAVPLTGDELVVVLDLVTVLLDLVRSDDQLEVVVLEERGGHCGSGGTKR